MKNSLAAVPVIAEGVRAEPRSGRPGLVLRRRLAPRGGLSAWLEQRLRLRRERAFELDAHGASFWAAIDGRRSLFEIEVVLRDQHHLPDSEARAAVIAFTETLMRRGLVQLRVPVSEEARDGH